MAPIHSWGTMWLPLYMGIPYLLNLRAWGGNIFDALMLADFSLRSTQWRTHQDGTQIHSQTAWAVLLKSQRICNREVIPQVQRRCSQFNQYHEPHVPITARKNRHIPHTNVLCNKPTPKLRRSATVCKLQS